MTVDPKSPFDAAATDTRYSLDYAAYLVCRGNPATVHLASRHVAIAQAVARRLPRGTAITVPLAEVASQLTEQLGRPVGASAGDAAGAVVVPFAASEWASVPPAPFTVAVEYNAWSYKSILAPGRLRVTAGDMVRWMRARCQIGERVGVMGPDFIALWALAELARDRRSDWHFRLRDQAMQHIFHTGPLWRYGYVVVLAGRRD